jgi:hypothetical protein
MPPYTMMDGGVDVVLDPEKGVADVEDPRVYSSRNAAAGSTRAAWRAGR